MKNLIRFFRHTSGATAIEYGLIAALISVAIVGGISSYGSATDGVYANIQSETSKVFD